MKLKACECFALVLIIVISTFGQRQSKPTTWKIDNVEKIAGQQVTVSGHPQIIDAPGGKAIAFDGVGDSLLLNANPLAGAEAFTLEAVFRPDAGGAKEQRWFHIQEDNSENRVLLETRLVGNEWFLDTFIKSDDN